MNNFFRAIIAGYGAKKLGGGCFGTIIVFIIIWVALGQCSLLSREVPPPETYPAHRRAIVNPAPPCCMTIFLHCEYGRALEPVVPAPGGETTHIIHPVAGLDKATCCQNGVDTASGITWIIEKIIPFLL